MTVRKAVCGAGLPLGLAEDIGRYGLWLAASGPAGLQAVCDALDDWAGSARADLTLVEDADGTTVSGPVSALLLAPAAEDRLALAATADRPFALRAAAVFYAPLLVAAMALGGADHGCAVRVTWKLDSGGQGAFELISNCLVDFQRLESMPVNMSVTAARSSDSPGAADHRSAVGHPNCWGIPVAEAVWRRLETHAARMLVPATDRSRLSGAGAGTVDTD